MGGRSGANQTNHEPSQHLSKHGWLVSPQGRFKKNATQINCASTCSADIRNPLLVAVVVGLVMVMGGSWTSISLVGVSFSWPVAGIASPSQQILILLTQVSLTGQLPIMPGWWGSCIQTQWGWDWCWLLRLLVVIEHGFLCRVPCVILCRLQAEIWGNIWGLVKVFVIWSKYKK